jgi:hypothetical protein
MKNGKKIKTSMDFNKYVVEDLDNDIEAIFADMMDDGFEVKKRTKELELFDIVMTRRTGTGFSFNIKPYKEHAKQLFDILERKGIQFIYGLVYLEGKSVLVNEVDSILKNGTDFRGKTFEEIWDGLLFTIYCTSEKDSITNFTMTFCEK